MDRLRIAIFVLLLSLAPAAAQQCGTLTTCPFASTPLSGSELLYVVQGGVSSKITAGQFAASVSPLTPIAGPALLGNANSGLGPVVPLSIGSGVAAALANGVNSFGSFPTVGGSIAIGNCLKWGPGITDSGASCGAGAGSAAQTNPITPIGVYTSTQPRSIVFIGDSITVGYPTGYLGGYVSALQGKIAARGPGAISNWMPFADVTDNLSTTGTVSQGTSGPLQKSLILAPSATASLTANDVDFFTIYYKQSATTTTTLTITDSNAAFVDTETTATGSGDSVQIGSFSTMRRGGTGVTFTVTNTGSNSLEINGVLASAFNNNQGPYLQVMAYSGYTTANFTSSTVLSDILAQTNYKTNAVFVLAAGTNDIYMSPVAVSPAQYIANINTIVTALKAGATGSTVVLVNPLIPQTLTPILAPLVDYETALYAYAATNGYDVANLSSLNFNYAPSYLYYDGLHPSAYGYQLLAAFYYNFLGLPSYIPPKQNFSISATSPYATSSSCPGPSATLNGSVVSVNGCFFNSTFGAAMSYPVNIGALSNAMTFPRSGQVYTTATTQGSTGGIGSITLKVASTGVISIAFGTLTTTPQFVFMDFSYDLSQQ